MARLLALLSALAVALDAAARVRVPLLPGWTVPVPSLIVAALALALAAIAGRIVLALLSRRARLPYIAVAVTWREARR